MTIPELVETYKDEYIAIRRDLHQHPELSKQEFRTTEVVKRELSKCGIEILDTELETGCIAVIHGKGPGKTIALRADMDALPVTEETNLPFSSQTEGVCHACGHDIHTASLLFTARILQEKREEFNGTVKLFFQPAEECGAGALSIIKAGGMQDPKPEMILGMHCSPDIPAGMIGLKKGPAMADGSLVKIKVIGKGGHGAHPYRAVDPIAIACFLYCQLQTIITRENNAAYPAILTFGSIHGGNAGNVIPDTVELAGGLRTFNEESRDNILAAIERMSKSCCEAMRGTCEVTIKKGPGPLVNVPWVIDRVAEATKKVLGEDRIYNIEIPSPGGDDFLLYLKECPGAYFRIGTWDQTKPETGHGLHNAQNVFDERGMCSGVAAMSQAALDFLQDLN